MKMKKAISMVLASVMMLSMCVAPASAMAVVDPGQQEITGNVVNTGVSPVRVQYEAQLFNVTMPSALPVFIDTNGTVYTATKTPIINKTRNPIHITSARVDPVNAFTLIPFDANLETLPIGESKVGMSLFNKNVPTTGTADISGISHISGGGFQNIDYNIVMAAQNKRVTYNPLKVTIGIDWLGTTKDGGGTVDPPVDPNPPVDPTPKGIEFVTEQNTVGNPDDGYKITGINFNGATTDTLDLTIPNTITESPADGGAVKPIKEISTTALQGKKFNTINTETKATTGTFDNTTIGTINTTGEASFDAHVAKGSTITNLNIVPGVVEHPQAWDGATITNKVALEPYTFDTKINQVNPDYGYSIRSVTFNVPTETLDLVIPAIIKSGEYGNTTGQDIIIKGGFGGNSLQNKTFKSIKVATTLAGGSLGGTKVNTLELIDGAMINTGVGYGGIDKAKITNLKYPSTGITIGLNAWEGCTITNTYIDGTLQQK